LRAGEKRRIIHAVTAVAPEPVFSLSRSPEQLKEKAVPILLPPVILDVYEVSGAVRIGLFVANNPVNHVDPLGLQLDLLLEPPPVTPPAEFIAPRPTGIPLPRVPGVSYPENGPFPPEGTIENINRPGKWGFQDPQTGRFKECWRFDKGDPNKPGWEGLDHFHYWGGPEHMTQPLPPFQWFSVPPIMNNNVNTPSIYPPLPTPPPQAPPPVQYYRRPPMNMA
jgi:hypothetical protein